ncbi:hypothetical protein ACO22_04258 [Paracoccidioides brasiliensis]|uniref:Uncharacterized protein n=1 Tax=Paracoccidioides brasiliensis TaxID=121759 RepID=A0A1D2JDM7_PARBR|nr:hypothetical protein ACO22_04258 [Paracoccidioides brasiliensis]
MNQPRKLVNDIQHEEISTRLSPGENFHVQDKNIKHTKKSHPLFLPED